MKNKSRSALVAVYAAATIAISASAFAAVKPGENLLVNGTLEADQMDFPPFWDPFSRSKECFRWHSSGGPNGLPYISVHAEKRPDVRLRQYGIDAVKDGRYRVSMLVRTKNFRPGPHTGVMLLNGGVWTSTAGVTSLPEDTTGRWVRVSKEFKCFDAPDGYMLMVRVGAQKGDLDFADVRLEAIDELALAKSGPSKLFAFERRPRMVPLFPLLSKITASDPAMNFRFFGELEKSDSEYEAFAAVDGMDGRVAVPLSRGDMKVPLPQGATNGTVMVGVAEKATGKQVAGRRYNFRVVPTVRKSSLPRRRLNNLCTEVLAAKLNADGVNKFAFAMSRDGWAYAAVKGRIGEGFSVRIDGKDVIWRDTPRHETFRLLGAGEHEIEVSGAEDGNVVVREIAEILNYCPGANSIVNKNPPYDWDFNEKYVLPAVTTQNEGNVPDEHREEFHRRGFHWLRNLNLTGTDAQIMIDRISKSKGMSSPMMDGVACDDQNYADVGSNDAYANGFWEYDLAKCPSRPVCTWAYGKTTQGAVDFDFLSACINISGGTGKLLREHYVATRETEEEARHYLSNYVGETFKSYRRMMPESIGSLGLVYGNFIQIPIISIAHHPEVDYKYLLDMQMNYAANDPILDGIGLIGYWGSYYADDELHRWSFALMRHYAVEGATNMLSKAYGYTYRPDHVLDGDFRKGLSAWRTKGNVRADSHFNFAERSEGRFGSFGAVGDTFAVLTRDDGEAAAISQTVKGLVPGRKYCLQFATFDVKDVKANRVAPRRFGLDATLSDGAEIDSTLSWVYVDVRTEGRYAKKLAGVARINLHHTVFTAKAAEVELKIDNSAAATGEELGVNYLSVKPYYSR